MREPTIAKKKTIRTIPQECTPMPEQDASARARNFEEVACGYTMEMALREADRCLQCPDEPCVRGCPVGIDIPAFIQKIAEKHYHGAYDVITDTNLLPSVCGRVCPQENQCEGVCTVGATLSRSRSGARALRRRHGDPRRLGEPAAYRARRVSRSASSAPALPAWRARRTWRRPAVR